MGQDSAGALPVPGSKGSPVLSAQESARAAPSPVSFSLAFSFLSLVEFTRSIFVFNLSPLP